MTDSLREDRRNVLTGATALNRNESELFSLELPIVGTVCRGIDVMACD